MGLKHIGIAVAALLAGSWMMASRAQTQAAGQDAGAAVRAGNIHILSSADHDIFIRAFAAAARSDWVSAMALGNQGQDTTARQLLQWRYALDRNSGAKFSDFGFLNMVQRAEGDSILAVQLGLRKDTPRHVFQQLIAKATADVR